MSKCSAGSSASKNAAAFVVSAALGFASGAILFQHCARRSKACSGSGCCSEEQQRQQQQQGQGYPVDQTTDDASSMFGEFDLSVLVRRNIAGLVPYRCARDDYDTGILLDANENSLGPPIANTDVCAPHLERYPSPYQWELRELYAQWRGVKKEQVFVGVGSDEAIDMLIRMVCEPRQDRILILPPTYGMYQVSATVNDVHTDSVMLSRDFQFSAAEVLAAIKPLTKIIFICSPNNPTANDIDREEITKLLESGYRGLVVVDEAYVDFSDVPSYAPLVAQFPNLVVLQTFSKSWGLAGMRCGVAIGSEGVVSTLNKMKAPYNLNKITSRLAVEALGNVEALQANVEIIKAERTRVMAALEAMPEITRVFPSSTNFIMFSTRFAQETYLAIAEAGVVIRYRGNCHNCEGCLRATVGTREENDAMLEKLASITAELAAKATAE